MKKKIMHRNSIIILFWSAYKIQSFSHIIPHYNLPIQCTVYVQQSIFQKALYFIMPFLFLVLYNMGCLSYCHIPFTAAIKHIIPKRKKINGRRKAQILTSQLTYIKPTPICLYCCLHSKVSCKPIQYECPLPLISPAAPLFRNKNFNKATPSIKRRHCGPVVSALAFQSGGHWFEPRWNLRRRVVSLDKKLNFTLSLFTQVYKSSVQAIIMLGEGVTLRWTSMPSRRE